MKKIIVIGILGAAGWYFYNHVMPTNQTWVHGKWKYQIDKPGEQVDYMVFSADGTVALENSRGRTYLTCVYLARGKTLKMECDVKGEKKELTFDISGDKQRLENAERRSVYQKIDA